MGERDNSLRQWKTIVIGTENNVFKRKKMRWKLVYLLVSYILGLTIRCYLLIKNKTAVSGIQMRLLGSWSIILIWQFLENAVILVKWAFSNVCLFIYVFFWAGK